MTIDPNRIGEEKDLLGEEGVDIGVPRIAYHNQTAEHMTRLAGLLRKVMTDQPIRGSDLQWIGPQIDHYTLYIDGTGMPLHMAAADTSLWRRNKQFIEQVEAGNFMNQANLKYLSNAAAKMIVAKNKDKSLLLPSLCVLTKTQAEILCDDKNHFTSIGLGLAEIHDDVATALSKFTGHELDLPRLTHVTEHQARSLAKYGNGDQDAQLTMGTIFNFDPPIAAAFGKFRGGLLNIGISLISEKSANAFAEATRDETLVEMEMIPDFCFPDLKTIDGDSARALASIYGRTLTIGLTEISDDVAKELSAFTGDYLQLDWLPTITGKQLVHLLTGSYDELHLNNITEMTDEIAKALRESTTNMEVHMKRVRTLTKKQKELLSPILGLLIFGKGAFGDDEFRPLNFDGM
jgi:hypothetical protein